MYTAVPELSAYISECDLLRTWRAVGLHDSKVRCTIKASRPGSSLMGESLWRVGPLAGQSCSSSSTIKTQQSQRGVQRAHRDGRRDDAMEAVMELVSTATVVMARRGKGEGTTGASDETRDGTTKGRFDLPGQWRQWTGLEVGMLQHRWRIKEYLYVPVVMAGMME